MQRPQIGPLGLTRRAEDLEELLSSRQEGGGGAADPPPAGHQQFQHARGGRRRAPPRLPHDAIRQSRRCNECSWYGRDCRPAIPARPGHRADKGRKPARHRQHLQERRSRQAAINRLCAATAYATTMPVSGRKNHLDLTLSLNTPRMPTELSIRPQPHFISLRQSRLYTTLSTQNARPAERLTHGVARKRHSQRHKTVCCQQKRHPPTSPQRKLQCPAVIHY